MCCIFECVCVCVCESVRPSVCLCGREGGERECVRERRDDSHEYKCFYTTKWFNIVFFVPFKMESGYNRWRRFCF